MTETPWFDPAIKPERVGPYKRRFVAETDTVHFSQWDGQFWLRYRMTPDDAELETEPSTMQALPWCGLVADPNATKEATDAQPSA